MREASRRVSAHICRDASQRPRMTACGAANTRWLRKCSRRDSHRRSAGFNSGAEGGVKAKGSVGGTCRRLPRPRVAQLTSGSELTRTGTKGWAPYGPPEVEAMSWTSFPSNGRLVAWHQPCVPDPARRPGPLYSHRALRATRQPSRPVIRRGSDAGSGTAVLASRIMPSATGSVATKCVVPSIGSPPGPLNW